MKEKIIEDLHFELKDLEYSIDREWGNLQSESKYRKLDGIYPFINNIRRYEAQKNLIESLIDKYEGDVT